MSVTARQLIYRACRHLRYAYQGGGIPADLEADGLVALNNLLESWDLDKLAMFTELISTYTLTANTTSFTIGTGGDLNGPRPLNIEQANCIINTVSPVVRKPIAVVGFREWSGVPVQAVAAIPQMLYYDRGWTAGLGKVYLWPQANQAYQLELYQWQALQSFADATTAYTFPPGYERALTFNLAVEMFSLAPDKFPTNPAVWQNVNRLARESKQAVEDYNSQPSMMSTDPAFMSQQRPNGAFNMLTGGNGNGPGSF